MTIASYAAYPQETVYDDTTSETEFLLISHTEQACTDRFERPENMKKILVAALTACALLLPVSNIVAEENTGAKQIILYGGKTGDIDFPHEMHQKKLGDCNLCHNLFPKEKDVILKMEKENKLKNKTVMNQCKNCHKELKKQKKAAGPTSCRACHTIKSK